MSDPSTLSREARIYRALWLKAAASETEIPIKLSSQGECIAFRMAMYRFIQPYRANPDLDPELHRATELVAISTPKTGQTSITLKPKRSLDLAEIAMELVGLTDEDLLTDGEKGMLQVARESEQVPPTSCQPTQPTEYSNRASSDIDARPSNPFFVRD